MGTRFYSEFAVALVKKITIFEKLGFYVYANDDKIRIVNARLETRVL